VQMSDLKELERRAREVVTKQRSFIEEDVTGNSQVVKKYKQVYNSWVELLAFFVDRLKVMAPGEKFLPVPEKYRL